MRLSEPATRFAQVTFIPPMEGYIRRMLWAAAAEGAIPATRATTPGARPSLGRAPRRRAYGGSCPLACSDDFERFGRELPRDVAAYIREATASI